MFFHYMHKNILPNIFEYIFMLFSLVQRYFSIVYILL